MKPIWKILPDELVGCVALELREYASSSPAGWQRGARRTPLPGRQVHGKCTKRRGTREARRERRRSHGDVRCIRSVRRDERRRGEWRQRRHLVASWRVGQPIELLVQAAAPAPAQTGGAGTTLPGKRSVVALSLQHARHPVRAGPIDLLQGQAELVAVRLRRQCRPHAAHRSKSRALRRGCHDQHVLRALWHRQPRPPPIRSAAAFLAAWRRPIWHALRVSHVPI